MSEDKLTDDSSFEGEGLNNLSALASAVLSALNERPEQAQFDVRDTIIDNLVRAALRVGAFNPEKVLQDLSDERVTSDQIVDLYVPGAARELGRMWSDDAIGFAKVTIATARLQGLLTQLAPPWATTSHAGHDGYNILMILQGNDSHTLGPHVATAQLRRMGASVRLLFGPDTETVLRVLDEESYDLALFSCSRVDALESISKIVKRIKTTGDGQTPVAVGGLVINLTDRIKEKTGADLVTNDVRVAFKLCDKKRHKNKFVAR